MKISTTTVKWSMSLLVELHSIQVQRPRSHNVANNYMDWLRCFAMDSNTRSQRITVSAGTLIIFFWIDWLGLPLDDWSLLLEFDRYSVDDTRNLSIKDRWSNNTGIDDVLKRRSIVSNRLLAYARDTYNPKPQFCLYFESSFYFCLV